MPAQYLLRIDDLCPTVSAERWAHLRSLIEEFHLKPILAVVPDNRDPELDAGPPDPKFWEGIRTLASDGAAIALHGYRHLCVNHGRSLVDLNRISEFAGVAAETQRAWVAEGVRILRSHGLNPALWVAPRHGFDAATIEAVLEQGIELVSDGFAQRPYVHRGITWIPQQLWAPVEKSHGLWTVCIHPNTAADRELAALRSFLAAHAAQFTSVDRALSQFQPAQLTIVERLQAECAIRRRRLGHAVGRSRRPEFLRASKSV